MSNNQILLTLLISGVLHWELFLCAGLPADWRSRFHASTLEDAEGELTDVQLSTSDDIIWAEETGGFRMESKHTGLMLPYNYWPNGGKCIPYKIHSEFGPDIQLRIKSALRIIENSTHSCITFKEHTDETEYIAVQPGKHCQSEIGRTPGQRTRIKLGNDCMKQGTILHEFLHALGLYHEQNRPDRDHYVEIFPDNILSEQYDLNFAILPNMSDYGTQYDMESILHYSPFAFARNPKLPTMLPKTPAPKRMGQRKYLSVLDVAKLRRAYGCVDENFLPVPQASAPPCSTSVPKESLLVAATAATATTTVVSSASSTASVEALVQALLEKRTSTNPTTTATIGRGNGQTTRGQSVVSQSAEGSGRSKGGLWCGPRCAVYRYCLRSSKHCMRPLVCSCKG